MISTMVLGCEAADKQGDTSEFHLGPSGTRLMVWFPWISFYFAMTVATMASITALLLTSVTNAPPVPTILKSQCLVLCASC